MGAIYQAIELQNVRVEGEAHHVGDKILIRCELVNTSDHPLDIPAAASLALGRPQVGGIQCWIVPIDETSAGTEAMDDPRKLRNRGAAGGVAAFVTRQVAPGIVYRFQTSRNTPSMGRYRFYVEYCDIRKDRVIQSDYVEFVVGPPN